MTDDPQKSSTYRANAVAEALRAKKGSDVIVLDVRETAQFTDYFIVASGTSGPHLKALAEEAADAMRLCGVKSIRQTGQASSGWMIVDGMDTVTHIFAKEARTYYGIEDLWKATPRLPAP